LASFEDALEVEAKYRAREINGLWSYIYIYIYRERERERELAHINKLSSNIYY
jgi:hypothetical protein